MGGVALCWHNMHVTLGFGLPSADGSDWEEVSSEEEEEEEMREEDQEEEEQEDGSDDEGEFKMSIHRMEASEKALKDCMENKDKYPEYLGCEGPYDWRDPRDSSPYDYLVSGIPD